jgi:ATP-dependent DNA helicase HFM1/MER3
LAGELHDLYLALTSKMTKRSELASFGIGVHHAGLTLEDRRATEDLYLRKILRVIVATSVGYFLSDSLSD